MKLLLNRFQIYRWWSRWYFFNVIEAGTPNGRLAKKPNRRLQYGLEWPNAKLCVNSCNANESVWLIVPPITYAQTNKIDQGEFRRRIAIPICINTDIVTWIDIFQSWPISCLISGYFSMKFNDYQWFNMNMSKRNLLRISFRRVAWGSSV